jgi:two-component system, LuxR family, response regulator DctR
MTVVDEALVHIVDDDEAIRDALDWLMQSRGLKTSLYASGEVFLRAATAQTAGCVVLDLRMNGIDGLATFAALQAAGALLPVIFLTGHGDVPHAVAALKGGAFDFVEKPFNDNELVDRCIAALQADEARRAEAYGKSDLQLRLDALSQRERQVMELVLDGKMNKVVADELGISMRTVEVHRANLFEKMGVRTAVELARLMARG